MKKNKLYYIVSGCVFALALFCFCWLYGGEIFTLLDGVTAPSLIVITATVLCVHIVRAFRQYLVLYGDGVPMTFAKEYCKVTQVGVLVPFKLGDVYRAYSYGHMMGDYTHGIVAVVADRFVDTLAVVFLMALIHGLGGFGLSIIFYVLCLFLVICLLAYWLFPGMYQYWKRYFLRTRATKRHNLILRALETANRIYTQLHGLVRGKIAIVYSLSLIAWMLEIGGFLLSAHAAGFEMQGGLSNGISDYLSAAVFGADSVFLARFVLVSLICLMFFYILLFCVFQCKKRRKSK